MTGNSPFLATFLIGPHLIHSAPHSLINLTIFVCNNQLDWILKLTWPTISKVLLGQEYFHIFVTFFDLLIEGLCFSKVVVLGSRMQ